MAELVDLTDDEILRFTQNKRRELVETLVVDGKMPVDTDSQNVLLSTLSDMDKQALGNKKVTATMAGSEADRLVAAALVTLTKTLGGRNPYENNGGGGNIPEVDRSLLPTTPLAPGEDEVGIIVEKYADFVVRVEGGA